MKSGYISRIENNEFKKYTAKTLNSLSRALGISPIELLGLDDDKCQSKRPACNE